MGGFWIKQPKAGSTRETGPIERNKSIAAVLATAACNATLPMDSMRSPIIALIFVFAVVARAAAPAPDAIVLVAGDLHSAYDRTAQFLARVDQIRADHPGVPVAVLINGDTFELGNAVAQRSAGAVDYALFTALATRVPTVVNLGNHEPEFHGVAETIARIQATGALVLGGNVVNPSTRQPYAPASTRLKLGPREAVVVGITTDRLSTFRVAVRPALDLADPVVWAKQHLPVLFRAAPLPILLTHTGLKVDRALLPLVPDGTLFAGAHDHLRFVQRAGRTVYFHSGSWTEFISVARLHVTAAGPTWEVEQQRIGPDDPADAALAALIRTTLAHHLTAEETAVVGRTPRALGPTDAAHFAVEAARRAAGADVALVYLKAFHEARVKLSFNASELGMTQVPVELSTVSVLVELNLQVCAVLGVFQHCSYCC